MNTNAIAISVAGSALHLRCILGSIQRTLNADSRFDHHVRVDHRRVEVTMTEQALYGANSRPNVRSIQNEAADAQKYWSFRILH
jgi:hypothetical protein